MLASWRLHIDDARAVDGEPHLAATGRAPVARMSARTAEAAGVNGRVAVGTDRGELIFDCVIEPEMVDGVVWVPARATGLAVSEQLAVTSGEVVRIGGVQ